MKKHTVIYRAGAALFFIGLLTAFLPHAWHDRIGLDGDVEHSLHVLAGIIVFVLGAVMMLLTAKKA